MIKIQILENNCKKQQKLFPYRTECSECGSVVQLDEEDIYVGWLGAQHFTCPCCGKESMIDELEGITLTVDNVNFPEHFIKIGDSPYCKECSGEVIVDIIKEKIEEFRKNKDWFAVFNGRGDTMVHVYRMDEDGEYKIIVSKGYYETDIPFEKCDYQEEGSE